MSRRLALVLFFLRVLLVAIVELVVVLQPRIASAPAEEAKPLLLVAVDCSAGMVFRDDAGGPSRAEAVQRLLGAPGNLLANLACTHDVRAFGFDTELRELPSSGEASGRGTRLDLPLQRALESGPGLAGILLCSDGRHNTGPSPISLARQLGQRKIPVFALGVGKREPPPDAVLVAVRAPSNVLAGGEAFVEADVRVTGLPAQEIQVELDEPGRLVAEQHKRTIAHDGADRVYTVRFQVWPKDVGDHQIQVRVKPARAEPAEITAENNIRSARLRVIEDKARVLLADGEARWEYHYLASALARDPTVHVDRVLFSQPRLGLIKQEELEKLGNPKLSLPSPAEGEGKDADLLHLVDCLILGDVAPVQLPLSERRRLERYVSERGGTLVILAGKRHMPLAFVNLPGEPDVLARLLPIDNPVTVAPKDGFTLSLTAAGRGTSFMQMDHVPDINLQRWAEFPRHYWGVAGRVKPAASCLAYASDVVETTKEHSESADKSQGIIVQHAYGLGRVIYVGLDSTWRWRYRVGDEFHHRLWGRLVRAAAAGRLLPAGNERVRFGSREPSYPEGAEAEIAVRVGRDVAFPLHGNADVLLFQEGTDHKPRAVVPLQPSQQHARTLVGKVSSLPAARYRIALNIPELASSLKNRAEARGADTFTVSPAENQEIADLAPNWPLLEDLARESGGRFFTPASVAEIQESLTGRRNKPSRRSELRLWRDEPAVWWFLGAFLAILTLEWVLRKRAGLA